ncbi:Imidazolonepropionase [Pseudidiomarina planktonica]|uniref:Imidazolonepropionase n=1 Tax=Pseudidiomarina planktonica TaxID=1323738 RepID=A0A1Y6EDM6_9GAMM|nr:amidohydrolase family protein [Pseudidiomarina planktonica]RUO66339.1 amidohydrolase [Pseudidiomarina planktonica]SMQ58722.1 Imidazolonepropionase [Pseudidiomarina planktonica]
MKNSLLLCLLTCLSISVADASEQANEQEGTVLYHNATLINPATEQQLNDGWLLVKGDRIINMGQQQNGQVNLPAAEQQIDLQDQYVLPGLIDVHLHLTAGPPRAEMQDDQPVLTMKGHNEITRYHALSTLATGVTTAFSPAGEPEANAQYARHQQAGDWLGPELTYAGYIFEPTPIVAGSVYPQNETAWQEEILRQKSLGVDYIKLYTGLNKDEVALGNRLAKAAGLKTVAHLDKVSWQYAADLGIDALTHALPTSPELLTGSAKATYEAERENPLNQRFIYSWFQHADYDSEPMQKLFSTLSEQQTHVDFTMVVNELFYYAHELDALYSEQDMWIFHPTFRSRWRATMAAPSYDWTAEDFAAAKQQLPKVQQLFKRLYDAGVPLAIGTDSVASGPFYLRELQLSKAAGLNNWQVLQLATVNGAQHLGLSDTGQLAPGFAADFIVLTANPVADLSALNTVETVVQKGKAAQVADLKSKLSTLTNVQL